MPGSIAPFWIGTVVYMALGILACLCSRYLGRRGKNPYASLSYTLIALTTVCTWLLWAVAWLMQWHPIISPEEKTET